MILHFLARASYDIAYSIYDVGVCDVFGLCILCHFFICIWKTLDMYK